MTGADGRRQPNTATGNKYHSSAPTTAKKPRVSWIDYAKGICIFFVVMFHVNDLAQEQLGTSGWLQHVVTFAMPFRMPDFFLIAGLFLESALRRPWRHYLDRKVIHFFYFYLLWMTLNFVVLDLQHALLQGAVDASSLVKEYLLRFLDPHGPLWFIHILPIFFVVTRLTRSVPAWVVWLIAAVLHSLDAQTGWHVPDELARRYVFFYSGYVLAPHVFSIARWGEKHARVAVAYLAGWGVTNGLLVDAGVAGNVGWSLVLGYLGALAVILSAVLLSTRAWTKPLRYLGENSIVVFLGELLVGMVTVRILGRVIPDPGTLALATTVLTIAGTIAMWRIVLRTPARFMYVRPPWLMLRETRSETEDRASHGR